MKYRPGQGTSQATRLAMAAGILLASCGGPGKADDDAASDSPWDAAACGDCEFPSECVPPGECVLSWDVLLQGGSAVDILVMVDDSRSMTEEQANLAAQFPDLLRALLDPPVDPVTGEPDHVPVTDLHVGIVSSDMGTGGYVVDTCSNPDGGDDGVLQHSPNSSIAGCEPPYPPFLDYESPEPDEAAIDAISTGFGCIATLGTDGCGFEQQLKAVARAIDRALLPDGPNAGFLRPDSLLAILWVTDEEDCSVADPTIFDSTNPELGHMNVRCFNYPEMVEPVATYVDYLRDVRPPERLVLGFITGVPQGTACEGYGDEIADCLDEADMTAELDPLVPNTIRPTCTSTSGSAMPARRLVEVAQAFGENAIVTSICTDDFSPAIEGLSSRLHGLLDELAAYPDLPASHPVGEACSCTVACEFVERMQGADDCPTGKPCRDSDDDGACDTVVDGLGVEHSLCTIPQAGTAISGCDPADAPGCGEAGITHAIGDGGWYYLDEGWSVDGMGTTADPTFGFTDGMAPAAGSTLYYRCEGV